MACKVDDTLYSGGSLKGIGNEIIQRQLFIMLMHVLRYLLSQSILSRAFKVLYVLVEAFEKYGDSLKRT